MGLNEIEILSGDTDSTSARRNSSQNKTVITYPIIEYSVNFGGGGSGNCTVYRGRKLTSC